TGRRATDGCRELCHAFTRAFGGTRRRGPVPERLHIGSELARDRPAVDAREGLHAVGRAYGPCRDPAADRRPAAVQRHAAGLGKWKCKTAARGRTGAAFAALRRQQGQARTHGCTARRTPPRPSGRGSHSLTTDEAKEGKTWQRLPISRGSRCCRWPTWSP